jgi:hypothetical protein
MNNFRRAFAGIQKQARKKKRRQRAIMGSLSPLLNRGRRVRWLG